MFDRGWKPSKYCAQWLVMIEVVPRFFSWRVVETVLRKVDDSMLWLKHPTRLWSKATLSLMMFNDGWRRCTCGVHNWREMIYCINLSGNDISVFTFWQYYSLVAGLILPTLRGPQKTSCANYWEKLLIMVDVVYLLVLTLGLNVFWRTWQYMRHYSTNRFQCGVLSMLNHTISSLFPS